jgi:hypothetical protein
MKLLKRLIKRLYYKKSNSKIIEYNLIELFNRDGIKYYKFPKETNMPLERFAMAMSLLERLSCGLSGTEMESILIKMEEALSSGLSNPKNAALVAAYIHVIRERQSTVIHRDILLNIAATWIIREDEDPTIINDDIHRNKLEIFEAMCKEGSHDFFTKAHIEPLIPLLSITPEEFQILWEYNLTQIKQLNDILKRLNTHLTIEHRKLKSN